MGLALIGAGIVWRRLGRAASLHLAKLLADPRRGFSLDRLSLGRRSAPSPANGRPTYCVGGLAVRHFCEGDTK